MVSLKDQGTLCSRKKEITVYREDFQSSFKKRRREDEPRGKLETALLNRGTNSGSKTPIAFDVELHLCTPLPLDWRGSLHTKGRSRAFEEPASSGGTKMSLDLELNLLPSDSSEEKSKENDQSCLHDEIRSSKCEAFMRSNKKNTVGLGLSRCPSWIAFEGEDDDDDDDDDDDQKKKQEMVATVCMKCHMLIMLSKSAPVCPNCKFMHPLDHNSKNLFKPTSSLLSLLC